MDDDDDDYDECRAAGGMIGSGMHNFSQLTCYFKISRIMDSEFP
jgi:hypothetical protein